jgi:hypothetical protein
MISGTLMEVNVAENTGAGVNARKARKLQSTMVGIIVRSKKQNNKKKISEISCISWLANVRG